MEAGTGSTCQKRKWPHPPLMAGSRKPVLPGLMGGKGGGGEGMVVKSLGEKVKLWEVLAILLL